jgi:CheY-like chemotaxis protein
MSPVLYVDDDADAAFFLHHVWERAQIPRPLLHLNLAQQAIDYLAGHGDYADRRKFPLPCLVLLDLNMPAMGGFDVLRWIRQQPHLAALKVVVLSGSHRETDLQTAQNLGALDYVTKPSDPSRLLQIVREKKTLWLPDGQSPLPA